MAEFIEILSPSALKDLQTANLEVVKLVANIDKVGKNMAKINRPSGSDTATKKLVTDYQKLEKQLAKTQQQLDKNRLQEIKLALAREKAFDKYDAQLSKEQAKLNASSNLYNKVQQKLNVLSNEYKALAVQKELTGRLTDKEAQRYDFLQGKIQKYDATLKAVDATMGKYQRNVGNYASGFNPLSNSINQLTREMPAFANSVQTGFMAISNNLPIFFDAMQGIIAQNKVLQAQGEPTTSVLKELADSFLSIGTALSIGVTLLTVFGDEIVEAIFSTKAKAKADEKAKEATDAKNKAEQDYIDTIINSASQEISNAKLLFENAKNKNIPLQQRIGYINELRETYPDYLKNLRDEDILAGNTAKSEELLNEALMKRGIAIALQNKISEAYKKVADAMILINQAQTNQTNIDEKAIQSMMKLGVSRQQAIKDIKILNTIGIRKAEIDKKNAEDEIKNLIDLYNKYAPNLKAKREDTESTKDNTKANKTNVEEKKKEIELLQNTEAWFEKEIARLKQVRSVTADTTEEYKSYNAQLAILENGLRLLRGEISEFEEEGIKLNLFGDDPAKMFEDWRKGTKETLTEVQTYWEEHGVEIVDLSQQLVNTLAEISNAQFEQQYQRLEKERDIAIMFAGESVTAREEIERQYEQRRAAIQRKQAEAEKKMAVFNIITDTAQAIVASLVRDPTGTLAIIIGAIGAAQLGLVLSTPIPQFAKGTDNAPEGWALTQEKGREIITDKSGKVKSLGNDKGAQYTYLNKGDKVFTNADTEAMMFNSNLNNMLLGNGIVMPKVEVSLDAEKITNEIKSLANTIANKEGLTIVRDERGERKYLRKQAETKELLNNVLTYKGIDV
jgi:hypothetical protein